MSKTIGVEDSCIICAQKHVTEARRALREFGYGTGEDAHDFAIGELGLAIEHVQEDLPDLAEKIREIRHYVQYWKYGNELAEKWKNVCHIINTEIRKELKIGLEPKTKLDKIQPSLPVPGKIYVFSNVEYPESKKIQPKQNDMLVFLNKSTSSKYYLKDKVIRFAYHRSQKKDYGEVISGCINQYVFDDEKKGAGIPKEFIDELKKNYDWNYEIEEGKVKSMTTGYMVVKWLEKKYPKNKIVLVNFGYDVKNSTYRCPWHNWKFEAEQLRSFEHMSTEEKTETK